MTRKKTLTVEEQTDALVFLHTARNAIEKAFAILKDDDEADIDWTDVDGLEDDEARSGLLNVFDDEASTSVEFAVDDQGAGVVLPLSTTSAVLVGGKAGAGKTSLLQAVAASLALSDAADLYIIDGSGGGEWDTIASLSERYIAGDDNTVEVLDVVETLKKMADEHKVVEETLFDEAPRQNVLIIDESADLFNKTNKSTIEIELVDRIIDGLHELMTSGAAAATTVILSSQRFSKVPSKLTLVEGAYRIGFAQGSDRDESALFLVGSDAENVSTTRLSEQGEIIVETEEDTENMTVIYVERDDIDEAILEAIAEDIF